MEEQQKRVAGERRINNNILTYTRITDNTESEKNISFVATFQYFRCLPYPTPQSYGLHLKIAWQVNKNCFVTLPEVNPPWEEKYYFLEKYLGPFDKKSSLQKIKLAKIKLEKRVLEAELIQLVGHSILVAQIAWHVSCRRGFFFCNCHFIYVDILGEG